MAASLRQYSYRPPQGFVPDEKTAIRIAEAVLEPIYGEKAIADERPFRASLKDGLWTVEGTLPKGFAGGVAIVQLWQNDGRIEAVVHEK
jgi:hypothetical protein